MKRYELKCPKCGKEIDLNGVYEAYDTQWLDYEYIDFLIYDCECGATIHWQEHFKFSHIDDVRCECE